MPLAHPHSLGRNGGLYQHTVLWEYLASHGFVVATVAEFGRDTAKPGMDFALDDLKLHQSDMRRALGSLSQLGFVDSTRVGAIGHSSGGIVALWLAAERPNIRAVIGLDASVNRDEGGKDMFFKGLGGRTASAAFLNICRWPHDEYVEYASRVLRGDYHRIGYTRAVHVDFQNWPAYLAFAGAREPSTEKTRSVAQALAQFKGTAQFTLHFLQAHLENNTEAADIFRSPDAVKRLSSGLATLAPRGK